MFLIFASHKIFEVAISFIGLLKNFREKILILAKFWVADSKKPLLESEDLEDGKETKEKKEKEARPVSYSYTFFHLIFALASMYSAMLLSGWTSSSDSSDLTDVGWTSVWVRICTEWVTTGLYVWSLVAPLLLPDREFF